MIRKGQALIFIVNMIYLLLSLALFVSRKNYEFVIYVGVVVFFLIIILLTNEKVKYSNHALWGLTAWGMLHMAGGGVFFNGARLYELMLVPISEAYPVFRYDQLVHIVGFAVATLVMWELLKPIAYTRNHWVRTGIIIVMAGLGAGALNEVVEFFATVIVPETGVGGYINTSLDLVADLIGAALALFWIRWRER